MTEQVGTTVGVGKGTCLEARERRRNKCLLDKTEWKTTVIF